MRSTFFNAASSLTLVTFATSAFARVAYPGAKRQTEEVCTQDDVLIGLFGNSDPNYEHDATTFCEGLLGLTATTSCIAYTTATTYVYPTTVTVNETVTSTFSSPTATVTVTATNVQFGLARRDLAARAAITARAEYLQPAINAIEHKARVKRQTTTDLNSAFSSACSCEHIDPGTIIETCTAPNLTVSRGATASEAFTANVTVPGGIATVTVTINSTQIISTASTPSVTTSPSSTTPLSTISTLNSTWGTWNWTTSQSTASSSTTSNVTSINPNNATTTMTSTTSTPVVTPSGCPSINGTTFASTTSVCLNYQYDCGITFPEDDLYDTEEHYSTPQACAAVCDAENTGVSTPCLGIVWNTTSTFANCRQIRDTSSPISDASSVALLLVANPSCNNSTSSTSTTTAAPISISSMPDTCVNGTGSGCMTSSTTTGGPYTNATTTSTTTPMFNITTSTSNSTTPYTPSSTGTAPINATFTSNSTCAVSTLTSISTVFGTMAATVTDTVIAVNISTVFVTSSMISTTTLAGLTATTTDGGVTETATITITETDTITVTAGVEERIQSGPWWW